ncbi:TNT domain-containing protein [Agromyces soli]
MTLVGTDGLPIDGSFAAPPGTRFDELALPPDRLDDSAVTLSYRVLKPLPDDIRVGEIAPGFGQGGDGITCNAASRAQATCCSSSTNSRSPTISGLILAQLILRLTSTQTVWPTGATKSTEADDGTTGVWTLGRER